MNSDDNVVYISALNNKGIETLKNKIYSMYNLDEIDTNDFDYVSSLRSINLIQKSITSIEKSLILIKNEMPIDIVEIEINNASEYLGDILGINYKEDFFNQLFSNFCLGK